MIDDGLAKFREKSNICMTGAGEQKKKEKRKKRKKEEIIGKKNREGSFPRGTDN